jgi:uncharacterized protein
MVVPEYENHTKAIVDRTRHHIEQLCHGDSSGHDWWHIHRVWQTARQIAEQERADFFVVELASLLHDIADWKFHGGDESAGPRAARVWLESLEVAANTTQHVCDIVAGLSFKGAGVPTPMATIEGQIVQDADRLDAIGAVGIARTFAYGGHKGQAMFDPRVRPQPHQSFADYKKNVGTTVNHFYEKLLLLKDRMNTASARQMAEKRHRFMEQFLEQFFHECGIPPFPKG